MNDALVFEKKYVNAEAKNTISYAKMMINGVAASVSRSGEHDVGTSKIWTTKCRKRKRCGISFKGI